MRGLWYGTEVSSNSIIKLLDGLMREYMAKMKEKGVEAEDHRDYGDEPVFVYTHPEYMIEVIMTCPVIEEEGGEEFSVSYIEFKATSGELVASLDRYCKNSGIRNPYETPAVFSSRLKNDRQVLTKSGWDLIARKGFEPYWTRIKGERIWKFRKTVVR